MGDHNPKSNKKDKKKKKDKHATPKYETKPQKFSHKDLVKQNVIVDVDEQVLKQTKANFNNLGYYFKQIGPDEFQVEVKYKVGFGAKISPFPEPFQLSLSKLLEMVTLQVNLLINLLNQYFMKKDKK